LKFDIFISHSSKNKNIAEALCSYLEANRLRCWIAPRDIMPGREWAEAILEGIAECSVMVILLSVESNTSQQVIREVERAVSQGKVILPVRIEDIRPSGAMEYYLSVPHWLDALNQPYDKHFSEVLKTCVSLLGQNGHKSGAAKLKKRSSQGSTGQASLPKSKQQNTMLYVALFFGFLAIVGLSAGLYVSLRSSQIPPAPAINAAAPKTQNSEPAARPAQPDSQPQNSPTTVAEKSVTYEKACAVLAAKDFGLAMSMFLELAQTGHANAQMQLGTMFMRGIGVPEDRVTARLWLQKSASQGNREASKLLEEMVSDELQTKTNLVRQQALQNLRTCLLNLPGDLLTAKPVAIPWNSPADSSGVWQGHVMLAVKMQEFYEGRVAMLADALENLSEQKGILSFITPIRFSSLSFSQKQLNVFEIPEINLEALGVPKEEEGALLVFLSRSLAPASRKLEWSWYKITSVEAIEIMQQLQSRSASLQVALDNSSGGDGKGRFVWKANSEPFPLDSLWFNDGKIEQGNLQALIPGFVFSGLPSKNSVLSGKLTRTISISPFWKFKLENGDNVLCSEILPIGVSIAGARQNSSIQAVLSVE